MEARFLAALILLPFIVAFIYAGIHEFLRYKSEGQATYGLVYNHETGTTHVTGIGDGEEAYDPEDYDPANYSDPDIKTEETDPEEADADGDAEDAVAEVAEEDVAQDDPAPGTAVADADGKVDEDDGEQDEPRRDA
ncbi:hypothetical protein [Mesobaculum littorinae]|uniref:hypothetical protein n=1 Tax=Mesobaculum littorinae TaxID=2486419 RepID=UPI0026B4C111